MLEFLLFFSLFLLGYFYLNRKNGCGGVSNIPGPWGLPILGHLPFLGFEPHKTFLKWKGKYGPIIGVRLGSFPTVVLNDGALIKKALSMTEFSGRPRLDVYDKMTGRKGIVMTDGPEQTKLRQFLIKSLKDFGYGTRSMDETITDQIPELLDIFEQQLNKPALLAHAFSAQLVNYMWGILTGKRFASGDSRLPNLVHLIEQLSAMPPQVALALFIPKLATWFPRVLGVCKLEQDLEHGLAFMKEEANFCNQNPAAAEEIKDHSIVAKMLEMQDEFSFLDETYLAEICFELFGGSIETTSSTLQWLFYYLIKYPDVQSKFQEEIDEQVGQDRLPTISDRTTMPYAHAVILETWRKANVLPFAIFHSALEDVQFQGYLIPKGTMIWANLYAAHYDPEFWGDPEAFRPERFLNSEGKLRAIPDQHFMPFSIGKRNCIGETLGRNQTFLYLTSILQRYKLTAGGELPAEKGVFGFTLRPEPFPVVTSRRNNFM